MLTWMSILLWFLSIIQYFGNKYSTLLTSLQVGHHISLLGPELNAL